MLTFTSVPPVDAGATHSKRLYATIDAATTTLPKRHHGGPVRGSKSATSVHRVPPDAGPLVGKTDRT
eukprot:scaffold1484_cov241-Pinguiococcus_pyrenoidosus.AAC.22